MSVNQGNCSSDVECLDSKICFPESICACPTFSGGYSRQDCEVLTFTTGFLVFYALCICICSCLMLTYVVRGLLRTYREENGLFWDPRIQVLWNLVICNLALIGVSIIMVIIMLSPMEYYVNEEDSKYPALFESFIQYTFVEFEFALFTSFSLLMYINQFYLKNNKKISEKAERRLRQHLSWTQLGSSLSILLAILGSTSILVPFVVIALLFMFGILAIRQYVLFEYNGYGGNRCLKLYFQKCFRLAACTGLFNTTLFLIALVLLVELKLDPLNPTIETGTPNPFLVLLMINFNIGTQVPLAVVVKLLEPDTEKLLTDFDIVAAT